MIEFVTIELDDPFGDDPNDIEMRKLLEVRILLSLSLQLINLYHIFIFSHLFLQTTIMGIKLDLCEELPVIQAIQDIEAS